MEKLLAEFKAYLERIQIYNEALVLIGWDSATGAPRGGIEGQARRSGFFSGEVFELRTSPRMREFIDALTPHAEKLDDVTKAMYRICKRELDMYGNVPAELMREYAELVTKSERVWEDARDVNDFAMFAPYLRDVIDYTKRILAYRGAGANPYNTLLDDYEPGFDTDTLDTFFAGLKEHIVPLLADIRRRGKPVGEGFLRGGAPAEAQRAITRELAGMIGFDLNRGMIKESAHPFTTAMGRDDVRITTKFHEEDFLSSIYSTIHECGHAIYEQNKRNDIAGTILDDGISMGVHESQSRFYENIIGRSPQFWDYAWDKVRAHLPGDMAGQSARAAYESAAQARPSLIRIEADELTYPLHIMIRYEIEKLIINGDVDVYDLPSIWNQKTEEYLGVRPENDAEGILQDMHWSGGLIGYFPSYAIGSALAAQLLHYMEGDMDVFAHVSKGEFDAIGGWLRERIHQYGSIYTPGELISRITGEPFNPRYYTDYMSRKFTELYGL